MMNAASFAPAENVLETTLNLTAPENWHLNATLYEAKLPTKDGPVVLISSAAGVPHGYYANYARYLIEHGAAAALTYDYRGMSLSAGDKKRWRELRMFHWAQYDFPAAAKFLKTRFPDRRLLGLGHSFGGQALGLSGVAHFFDRYATVATMSGYWKNLDTPYSVWFQTQVLGRILVNTLGYVPKGMGVGEAFPGSIMRDWATWINHPEYWFDETDVPGLENFRLVALPYLSIGISDDPWGTKKAVDAFMKHYSNAQFEQIWLDPGVSGKIGHLGYFRQKHRDTHWSAARDFLFA